jgi:hypothetical protein
VASHAQSTWLQRIIFAAILGAVSVGGHVFAAGATESPNYPEPAVKVTRPDVQPRRTEPTYKVSAGIDGDIFPVFANFASMQTPQQREFGMVSVEVSNSSDAPVRDRISVHVSEWSDTEIQIAELGAGQVRTFKFAPTFLPRFYRNHEITGATALIEIHDMGGHLLYQSTVPVRLRSADDMYWGTQFKYAPFIASWVTPHADQVEDILSKAKELMPQRRLPGYEEWKDQAEQEKSTELQARAIYNAIKQQGISYVKSSITFGGNTSVSQRVRMPRESINYSSANCIDASVMFASLFENLAMDPIVVLVPGHAYVGVRVAQGSQHYLFIDVALVGRSTYDVAVHSAEAGLAKYGPSQITRIPIDSARNQGIYPMP